ncbi:amidase [Streptomyces sp. CB02923]|uniref:Asp-tRNA(Asn)/Glu-tRNA(Gln) amidotransferase GatCAB subunit A n=1 Tax=Streptomyces sp. CB02923 TaxID=1718985 RepID=UPI00093A6084|nr:Asp-tRNA(Asn)/Glu-tRNA(Gln) amidotransferase GatCAB subunit A [Streptomyces sp. CB02923]OKI00959.1 amidase [Streptomyces sp. CB02923]
MQLYKLTLAAAAEAIASKELSPVELTASVLQRLDETEDTLNAYVTVTAEAARTAAAQAEREIMAGRYRGPLHGIPFALKDTIDVSGVPTTAGSRLWADRLPTEDSAVTRSLASAGAVLVGKTQTHEFAYGLITPQTANPWHTERIAGGSSGGSAVAVAAGSALFALGTDTAGSIRVPAALNGVVGLKPTYGLVSRWGVAPLSWSLDHVGPITRNAHDAALVLDALAGRDVRDPASITSPNLHGECGRPTDLRGLRVGIPRNHFFHNVTAEVAEAVRAAIDRLGDLGVTTVDVEIPLAEYILPTLWGLMGPEAASVHEHHLQNQADLFGADVRILLEAGQLIPADDYMRAQRARSVIRRSWRELFDTIDVLAAPTVACTAAERSQPELRWADGAVETVTDAYVRLTAPMNVTGLPSVSIPIGFDGAGLPLGLQLTAGALAEPDLLRTAIAYERAYNSSGILAEAASI